MTGGTGASDGMGVMTRRRMRYGMPNMSHGYRKVAKASIALMAMTGVVSVPVTAHAVDATDHTYAHDLLNSQSAAGSENANAWVSETIQNYAVTGYEDKGSVQSVLANAQAAFRGIFAAVLGTIIVLFAVKMVGRAIFDMTTRDEETFNTIPAFFQTAKERSSIKEPTIMRVRGSLLGGPSVASGGGKPLSELNRNYSGPTYLSDHPYVEFMKEFIAFMLGAFAAFVAIELIMGAVGAAFARAQNADSDLFTMHSMFGI